MLSIFSCGESPRRHRAYLWLSYGKRPAPSTTVLVEDDENDLPESLIFFGGFWFHLVHSVVFPWRWGLRLRRGCAKIWACPLLGGFIQRINSALLIDTVIRLLNPLWDHQLNGAHSQAVHHLLYFFHPLEPCRSSVVVGMNWSISDRDYAPRNVLFPRNLF